MKTVQGPFRDIFSHPDLAFYSEIMELSGLSLTKNWEAETVTLTDILRKKILQECSGYLKAVSNPKPEQKLDSSDRSEAGIEFTETARAQSKPWIEVHQYWIRWHTLLASAGKDYLLLIMGLSVSDQ